MMLLRRAIIGLLLGVIAGVGLFLPGAESQEKPPDPKPAVVHGRGHKKMSPEKFAKLHAENIARHGNITKRLPRATPATFDCVALGWTTPVQDQGQCGS